MQDGRTIRQWQGLVRGAGAGMVGHHAPSLSGLVVDVGGDHPRLVPASRGVDFNALDHAVNRAGQGLHALHMLQMNGHGALRQQGFKSGTDGADTDQPGAAWVHADDVVLIGPASYQLTDIPFLQGVVKRHFDFSGRAAYGDGLKFGFGHGDGFGVAGGLYSAVLCSAEASPRLVAPKTKPRAVEGTGLMWSPRHAPGHGRKPGRFSAFDGTCAVRQSEQP